MDFNFTEDINFMRENVRKFVQEEVEPVAMEIEEKDNIPKRIVDMSKEMGLFSLGIPEEYGGLGLDMVGKCVQLLCCLCSQKHWHHMQDYGCKNE